MAGIATVPEFDVVIVNWYGWEALRRCVEHVHAAAAGLAASVGRAAVNITVVDNSLDLPPPELAGWLAGKAEFVRSGRNIGFGSACNRGAAMGQAPYILFLNGDAWPCEDALSRLRAEFTDGSAEAMRPAVIGARMFDDRRIVHPSCWRFPSLGRLTVEAFGLDRLRPFYRFGCRMREFDHAHRRPVDQVIGAFLAIRREEFSAIGGFDERFFLYYEEVDLCRRISAADGVVLFVPDIGFSHMIGRRSRAALADRLAYNAHSRIVYGRKHFGFLGGLYIGALALAIEPVVRLVAGLFSRRGASPRSSARYVIRLLRGIRRSGWNRSVPLDRDPAETVSEKLSGS